MKDDGGKLENICWKIIYLLQNICDTICEREMLRIKDWIMEALVTQFTRAVIFPTNVEVDGLNVAFTCAIGCNTS